VNFQPDEEHGLTIFGGVLSIISTILGGGIVALPWSFYMLGIYPAIIMMIMMAALTVNSTVLYLKAKDLTPGKPESIYELGYILMKRSSIFLISGILTLNGLGMCMIYFIIFGNTIGSIVASISD
jgi:amino acid permease